ncbi:YtxH domain-containing protein [Candidatus Saccharibacteria bacterium]|nr:YtxH domain-containing protein [Candidatus Saccharibacteria bacterium]
MSRGKSSGGKFFLGAVIGGAIGAVAGLLSAPKSGKETRADLKKKADEAKEFAGEKTKEAKKAARKVVKKAKKAGQDVLNYGEDDKTTKKPSAKK